MNNEKWFELVNPKPVCSGTGLIVLDVVINSNPQSPPLLSAGGSCGNVLIILAYLGWESYPIAKLGNDDAAEELIKDLVSWGVKTSLIKLDESSSTPVIIERISKTRKGTPKHRYEWTCPNCGAWLPKFRPILHRESKEIVKEMPRSKVFYFDRLSRSSITLAKENQSRGALIVFEPSGIKDEKLFSEALQVSDIVKYSHERLGHAKKLIYEAKVSLVIETLGEDGLEYRLKLNGKKTSRGKSRPAYVVESLKDSAGAGDWCTAGIIHLLGSAGREGFLRATDQDIDDAMKFGQALAALKCRYEGPRGNMYTISKQKFKKLALDILNKEELLKVSEEAEQGSAKSSFYCISPQCQNSARAHGNRA
jgi:fructokinase